MINAAKVEAQLRALNVNCNGWGRAEYKELSNILGADEVVEACVNGYYEAGFALLVATRHRVLVIDKKPMNSLTVEDMRFDMINEFDYQHRLFGAQIKISAGNKLLHFTSWNQFRLRQVLTFVQTRMIEIKQEQEQWQSAQQRHLEQMNKQLEMFLQLQQLQQQKPLQQLHPSYDSYALSQQAQGAYFAQNTADTAGRGLKDMTPAQLGIAAMKRVVPVISAYTRLPLLSQRRRFGNAR
ncbi:MAG TPA: PH domain-containing protein [Candidatus Saccharimonadales bacterium]|nr:PH domain-containing protein [Candidatus Saccharimonadales bacterium]